jgi:hypothetical protein
LFTLSFPVQPRLGVLKSLGLGAVVALTASISSPFLLAIFWVGDSLESHDQYAWTGFDSALDFGSIAIVLSLPQTIFFSLITSPIADLVTPKGKHFWILTMLAGIAVGQWITYHDAQIARERGFQIADHIGIAAYYGAFIGWLFGYVRNRILLTSQSRDATHLNGDSRV